MEPRPEDLEEGTGPAGPGGRAQLVSYLAASTIPDRADHCMRAPSLNTNNSTPTKPSKRPAIERAFCVLKDKNMTIEHTDFERALEQQASLFSTRIGGENESA